MQGGPCGQPLSRFTEKTEKGGVAPRAPPSQSPLRSCRKRKQARSLRRHRWPHNIRSPVQTTTPSIKQKLIVVSHARAPSQPCEKSSQSPRLTMAAQCRRTMPSHRRALRLATLPHDRCCVPQVGWSLTVVLQLELGDVILLTLLLQQHRPGSGHVPISILQLWRPLARVARLGDHCSRHGVEGSYQQALVLLDHLRTLVPVVPVGVEAREANQ